MQLTGLGGGIMLAIAAALWMAYLLPSWLKSREYLATEKNAVRLQQTIRVLAETSEIAARQDIVRRLPSGPVAVGRPARAVFETPEKRSVSTIHRLRRTRVAATLVLLVSVVVGLVQVISMLAGASAVASWLVLGASGIGALSSFAMLGRLAEVARSRRSNVARPARRTSLGRRDAAPIAARADWTPVAVPKPLYLSRSVARQASIVDPTFELEVAAAAAERALRDIEQPPAIAPKAPPQTGSRFATMGIVDAASAPAPDLDAVLARRRAAG